MVPSSQSPTWEERVCELLSKLSAIPSILNPRPFILGNCIFQSAQLSPVSSISSTMAPEPSHYLNLSYLKNSLSLIPCSSPSTNLALSFASQFSFSFSLQASIFSPRYSSTIAVCLPHQQFQRKWLYQGHWYPLGYWTQWVLIFLNHCAAFDNVDHTLFIKSLLTVVLQHHSLLLSISASSYFFSSLLRSTSSSYPLHLGIHSNLILF